MQAETLMSGRDTAAAAAEREFRDLMTASYARLVAELSEAGGDPAVAGDVVREAFVRAAAAGSRFLALADRESWLRNEAVVLGRSPWRRLARRARRGESQGGGPADPVDPLAPPDPALLLQRGRALRRRRLLLPLAAVAVAAALAAVLAPEGGGPPPVSTQAGFHAQGPSATAPKVLGDWEATRPPGDHLIYFDYLSDYSVVDRQADATVRLVGRSWERWSGGAFLTNARGSVSWGLHPYDDVVIDPCRPDRHAATAIGAVRQLSVVPGRVAQPPRSATVLGLTGTHLRLSVPAEVECRGGAPGRANLMALGPAPRDPFVTVDAWVLDDGDRLLLFTRAVRGTPSTSMLRALDQTLSTLRLAAAPCPERPAAPGEDGIGAPAESARRNA